VRTPLTIRQIAPQGADPSRGKFLRQRDQQRGVRIAAGAMRQYKEIAGRVVCAV
jgi:hypothetical protein